MTRIRREERSRVSTAGGSSLRICRASASLSTSFLLTVGAIDWIKSLDITWYSSIWGFSSWWVRATRCWRWAFSTVILLSRYEPMKTMLRTTEQHDLGKLAFAFVMLNIYLCFAEFLIIWSGNVPDEIPWYLNRIHGGWWYVCSADFICHWLIPFVLLLSRDLKRNKQKMIWLTSLHDLCPLPGYVLADRTELRRCCGESAPRGQYWNSCLHHRSCGRDFRCGPRTT